MVPWNTIAAATVTVIIVIVTVVVVIVTAWVNAKASIISTSGSSSPSCSSAHVAVAALNIFSRPVPLPYIRDSFIAQLRGHLDGIVTSAYPFPYSSQVGEDVIATHGTMQRHLGSSLPTYARATFRSSLLWSMDSHMVRTISRMSGRLRVGVTCG